jgi:DNA-binding NarL/FixJ family response regulator
MEVAGLEQAEQWITRCRLAEAASRDVPLRASALALLGDDAGLAGLLPPQLLVCKSAQCAIAYLEALDPPARSHDYLVAGVAVSWAMDAPGTYDLLRVAHQRALAESNLSIAVGARERLAHHALLFGDVELATEALDDALRFATQGRLYEWFTRCAAAAARLALDTGDSDRAARLLARARPHAHSPEATALLAPVGAALAIESGDEEPLRRWNAAQLLETATRSPYLESAIAATIALLIGNEASGLAVALRRCVLQSPGYGGAVELLSLAAQHAEMDEARMAADALTAMPAPNRKYLRAHALLARAHLLFRCAERAAWIDNAGDAARAFNAMGMRRWMNDAMQLLVRQENDGFPQRKRGRTMGSALTGREQQVAHLIRRGARNREVAAALQISEHTVERHVSSILGRLGLRSRWQIVDPKNSSQD